MCGSLCAKLLYPQGGCQGAIYLDVNRRNIRIKTCLPTSTHAVAAMEDVKAGLQSNHVYYAFFPVFTQRAD